MIKKVNVILLFCFFMLYDIQAQKDSLRFNRSEIDIKTENIIDIIKDMENKDIHVFSNNFGTKEIKEGYYKGDYTGNFEEGVVFNDGNIYKFSENESYLFNIGNNIYTICPDFIRLVKNITSYKLEKDKLTKVSDSLSIPFHNSPFKLKNSEFIIVSDEYELQGNSLKLYDKCLKFIMTYSPYEGGFSTSLCTFINGEIYIISTPNTGSITNKEFKVTIIDSKNNFTIYEKKFTYEITPIDIVLFENKFLLIGVRKILLLNKDADILWDKSLNIGSADCSVAGSESENKIFLISDGAIVCLSLMDGAESWRIPLQDIYPTKEDFKNIRNEYYVAYMPIGMRVFKSFNLLGLLTVKSEQFVNKSTNRYSNKNLTLINYSGKIIKQIPISSANKFSNYEEYSSLSRYRGSKLLNDTAGFKILSNGKIEKFGIEKTKN